MGFKDRIVNPCPEDQLWGDLTEDRYENMGDSTCPKGKWCPYFRDVNGRDITYLFPGNKRNNVKSCWNRKGTKPPYNKCLGSKYCKNLDILNSSMGNLKFKCPDATCQNGQCQCGDSCYVHPKYKICVPTTPPSSTESPSSIEPDSSNEVEIDQPITIPKIGECSLAEIGEYLVCWQRKNEDELLNCPGVECGLQKDSVSKMNVAGSEIQLYNQEESESGSESGSETPLYKKWWFWVIIVLLLAAAAGSGVFFFK